VVVTGSFYPTQNASINRQRSRGLVLSTEWVFFVPFVAGLAWAPFWLGSNRWIAWGINAVVFPGLAALYELSLLLRAAPHPIPIRRIRISAILFIAAVIWVFIQNATWTPIAWQHPIWQLASEVLGRPVSGSISIDRDMSAIALLRLMTVASAFWLALQLSADAARARLLIWCVVGICAAYAGLGLFALGFMPGGRMFAEFDRNFFSTFVNRNHFATFAGIGLIAALGQIVRLYRRGMSGSGSSLRMQLAMLIDTTAVKAALPLTLAFVILVALFLSGSRAGIIATGVGVFALCLLTAGRGKHSLRNQAALLGIATLVLGAALFVFGQVFFERIAEQGLYDEGRPRAMTLTIRSILSSPLLGFGYGTFPAVFSMFRDNSLSVWFLWDKAHNTYLEVFQDLGLLFGAMLIASAIMLVWDCLNGARTRKRNATIPAIAASVSFLVGVHAFVDFSLQIQAVALTYMAVLGAGVAQARDVAGCNDSYWGAGGQYR
jgi:hypothetical protein